MADGEPKTFDNRITRELGVEIPIVRGAMKAVEGGEGGGFKNPDPVAAGGKTNKTEAR